MRRQQQGREGACGQRRRIGGRASRGRKDGSGFFDPVTEREGEISLDGLQGKVVIIDFWATWCDPCKASFPKLEELSKKLGDKAEIVGVSVDEESKGIAEFAKANGATFAVGWDEGHAIAKRWGDITKMPTTFIVD